MVRPDLGRSEEVGRKRLLTQEQVVALNQRWSKGETLEGLAAEAGVSIRTLERSLRREGVAPGKGIRKTKLGAVSPYHFGVVGTWLAAHPSVRLPHSYGQIAALIGCTPKAVKRYMEHRADEVKAVAKVFKPWWLGPSFVTVEGRTLPARAVASWRVSIEPWTLAAIFRGKLRGTNLPFTLRLDLPTMRKAQEALTKTAPPTSQG
jgi:hypothetical protein